jgi:hypothetical protein
MFQMKLTRAAFARNKARAVLRASPTNPVAYWRAPGRALTLKWDKMVAAVTQNERPNELEGAPPVEPVSA